MGAILQQDSFEGAEHVLSSPPGGTWISNPSTGGVIEVTTDPGPGGVQGQVVRVFDNSASSFSRLAWPIPLTPRVSRFIMECRLYAQQANRILKIGPRINEQMDGGFNPPVALGINVVFGMRADGFFGWSNNQTSLNQALATPYLANTWYKVRFSFTRNASEAPTLRSIYVNDALVASNLSAWTADWNFDQIVFATDSTESGGIFFVDDVKFADFFSVVSGIVRKKTTGQPAAGALVALVRQDTNTVIATTTANAAGAFTFSAAQTGHVGAVACEVIVIPSGPPTEGISARPHIQVI